MRYQGKHSVTVKRRGKSFRAQLAKEFGVEKTPDSFRMAMEKTYKELPMDMPAAYRPVRTFLRRMATAAAACGLIFLALLGVNTTYPQLTEALPGLGMVFQAINSGNRKLPPNQELPDDRSHLMLEEEPDPTPTPAPSFQPVTLQSSFGDLIIEDAWSDGVCLWMEMSLEPQDKALREMLTEMAYDEASGTMQPVFALWPGAPSLYTDDEGVSHSEVIADSELYWGDTVLTLPLNSGFAWDEEKQKLTAAFYMPVAPIDSGTDEAESLESGFSEILKRETMLVRLSIPSLTIVSFSEAYGGGLETLDHFVPDYGTKFLVEIDGGDNLEMEPLAEDNGVIIQRVIYTPSQIILDAELPNIGFGRDTMISDSGCLGWDMEQPLGIYADLVRKAPHSSVGGEVPEGDTIIGQAQASEGETGPHVYYSADIATMNGLASFDYSPEIWGDKNGLRYHFVAPDKPEDTDLPLVLTFYETPDGSNYYQPEDEINYNPRVLAEFTIDPKQGRVYASENYKAEHREKVDRSKGTGVQDAFENGFFCSGITSRDVTVSELSKTIWLTAQEDMASRTFSIIGYRNEEPTASFTWQTDDNYLENEFGEYILMEDTVPSTGQVIFISRIRLFYPEYAASYDFSDGSSWFTRLELVDADTGEVLISDLRENALRAQLEALGSWVDYEEKTGSPSPTPSVQPFGPAARTPWADSDAPSQPGAVESVG